MSNGWVNLRLPEATAIVLSRYLRQRERANGFNYEDPVDCALSRLEGALETISGPRFDDVDLAAKAEQEELDSFAYLRQVLRDKLKRD